MNKILITFTLLSTIIFADIRVGETLKNISIGGSNGGYFNAGTWNSSMLNGMTTMIMYVDPDESAKGEDFKPFIERFEQDLDFNTFQILVILNLNATWKPNSLIETLLKEKANSYPKRKYILDKNSVLVKKWNLIDDEYNVLVVDSNSKVIYSHSGKWNQKEITKANSIIRTNIIN